MPRASGSGKRHSGGGQRDSRHDNASSTSSRKGSGRKSLPAATNPAVASATAAAAPAASNNHHALASPSPHSPHDANDNDNDNANASSSVALKSPANVSAASIDSQNTDAPGAARRPSLDAEYESSDASHTVTALQQPAVNGHPNGASLHRHIDVNLLKDSAVHRDSGLVEMATTILKLFPMQDTLAILIILMHMPSVTLSIIYAVFALLTFFPPVKTTSGMNLNIAEIFDGNSITPSFLTVVCFDFLFLLIWLFLWQPIQDVVLDLAKPIIAITLGGATRNDPSLRGIRTGFAWVLIYHVIRGTQPLWAHLIPNMPDLWRKLLSEETPIAHYSKLYDKKSPYGWLRSGLAIHIITQSMTRYVKEWYLRILTKPSNSTNTTDSCKQSAHTGLLTAPDDANPSCTDAEHALSVIPSFPPHPPPVLHQSSAKKRRKQSAQVRLKQPLWAALASTKIVVVKEYELTYAASESAGANATGIHNLGNAPFPRQSRQIWITFIGYNEVCFHASYFPCAELDKVRSASDAAVRSSFRSAGLDISKPFYVKVNNAIWQPTNIYTVSEEDHGSNHPARWIGEIYGLRSASKYVCDFIDSRTGSIIFTATIRTAKEKETARSKDGGATTMPDNSHSSRPDSPVTTLKTSIDAASERLAEEKSRLKNARKEWKIRINSLKREIESTEGQLATAGSGDEKYRQKIKQNETQRSQSERDMKELEEKVEAYDSSPELAEKKQQIERAFSAEKQCFDNAQKEVANLRTELEREVKRKERDRSNLSTRRNKIATRIARMDKDLVNLMDANNRGLNEAERRKRERKTRVESFEKRDRTYSEHRIKVGEENRVRRERVYALQAQLEALQRNVKCAKEIMMDSLNSPFPPPPQPISWKATPQQPGFGGGSSSSSSFWPVARGDIGPAALSSSVSSTARAPSSTVGLQASLVGTGNDSKVKNRMRSSSLLSDVSGFIGSNEGSAEEAMFLQYQRALQGRPGLGHGGTGINGSSGMRNGGRGSPI